MSAAEKEISGCCFSLQKDGEYTILARKEEGTCPECQTWLDLYESGKIKVESLETQ